MKVHYEDIKTNDWEVQKAVMGTLKAISWRINEPLEIECQSPEGRKGWTPSLSVLTMADKIVLDGKIIKDKFGGEV